jgi:ABC-type transporter Mla MlaB component
VALQRNNKHFHEALVRLVGPFWGRPRIAALLQSYIDQVQIVESVAWDVIDARHVDTATGVHLDTLGAIVGQPRFTSDDATYRNVIRAKIAANRSKGTTDSLINVVRLAGDVSSPVQVTHVGPAVVRITLTETVDAAGLAALAFILPKARAAGVRLALLAAVDEDAFILDDSASAITGAGILDNSASAIAGAGTLSSAFVF